MTDAEEKNVTANALALAIFKDNLRLHKELESCRVLLDDLRHVVCSPEKPLGSLSGCDLWDWYLQMAQGNRQLRNPPLANL